MNLCARVKEAKNSKKNKARKKQNKKGNLSKRNSQIFFALCFKALPVWLRGVCVCVCVRVRVCACAPCFWFFFVNV